MKSNSLQEEMVKTFEVYEKVLEFFSSTFTDDIYFNETIDFVMKKLRARKDLVREINVNEKIKERELFTKEQTSEKFSLFYEKLKKSKFSIEAAYSLIFGLENSILEKLLPVEKFLKEEENQYLKKFISETKETISWLRERAKFFNLNFL